MKYLIDIQEAIDAAIAATDSWYGRTSIGRQKRIANALNALPKEPLEIIRCKDCKWSEEYVPMCKAYYYCRETGLYGRTEDDFCSRAERREEGEG